MGMVMTSMTKTYCEIPSPYHRDHGRRDHDCCGRHDLHDYENHDDFHDRCGRDDYVLHDHEAYDSLYGHEVTDFYYDPFYHSLLFISLKLYPIGVFKNK